MTLSDLDHKFVTGKLTAPAVARCVGKAVFSAVSSCRLVCRRSRSCSSIRRNTVRCRS